MGVHGTGEAGAVQGATVVLANAAELYTNRATRLMRLFAQQAELLAKLQGITIQQRVSIEHIHVNSGGQAVVGLIGSAAPGMGSDE